MTKVQAADTPLLHTPIWREYGACLSEDTRTYTSKPKDGQVKCAAIILHGQTHNGAAIMRASRDTIRDMLPGVVIIAPDAPYAADPDQHLRARKYHKRDKSFSWFELPEGRFSPRQQLGTQIRISADRLHNLIDDTMRTYNLREENIYLIGFSQGGAIALQTALERERQVAGVAALCSPFFDPVMFGMNEPKSRPPVFYGFDLGDEVMPAGLAYHAMTAMKRLKLDVTMHITPAGAAVESVHYDHKGRPYMALKAQPGAPLFTTRVESYRDKNGTIRYTAVSEKTGHWVNHRMKDALLYTLKNLKDDPDPILPELGITQLSQELTPRITSTRLALWWALNPTVLSSLPPLPLRPMNAWNRMANKARRQATAAFGTLAHSAIKWLAPLLFDFPEKVDKALDGSSVNEEVVNSRDLDKLMGRPKKRGLFNS